MTKEEIAKVLLECKFNDWWFHLGLDGDRPWLQVRAETPCNVEPGKLYEWGGRKWFLSPHMTKSEIVQTAFKAVMTAMEHEVREQFKYKGRPIFDPHYDVDLLWELRGQKDALDERD